jgi:hypothetical protein
MRRLPAACKGGQSGVASRIKQIIVEDVVGMCARLPIVVRAESFQTVASAVMYASSVLIPCRDYVHSARFSVTRGRRAAVR